MSSVTAFLRCAAESAQGISLVFSAFTIRCIYVSCVFIDTDKQETKNTLRVPAFTEREVSNLVFYTQSTKPYGLSQGGRKSEGERISDHCSV